MLKWNPSAAIAAAVTLLVLNGCAAPRPDYLRPLAPGEPALRKITDPAVIPSLKTAFENRDQGLLEAIDRSLAWFDLPSARTPYPLLPLGVTQEHARASTAAFRQILVASDHPDRFQEELLKEFDIYSSVGWDGGGDLLFTGYYAPIFRASKVPTGEYRYPLYGRPPDLAMEQGTDKVLGRSIGGQLLPYPTRAEIESDPARLGLTGGEIAWLSDKLDAYLVHVQGSARLDLNDGGPPLYVGYAASNGREYTSLGRLLVADGKIERGHATIPAIRAYFREHPEQLDSYLSRNDRYIFFREEAPSIWPAGSLGFAVTPMRSLATDKTIYPQGCVVLVRTQLATPTGALRPFEQFMLDQDAGGAIRTPGRADLYLGVGDPAGEIAGRQSQAGRLYYFLLKTDRIAAWSRQPDLGRRPAATR